MSAAVARKRSNRTSTTATSRSRTVTRASSRSGGARNSRGASVGRPSLQVFDQVAIRNRARRRYVIIAGFVVLLAGLFAVALIQAQLVANQHRLDRLRSEIATSEVEHTRLERLVEEASAPSSIINQAMELGMVRATEPIYLAPNEPAVAVPVPISLGQVPGPPTDEPIVAGPDVVDVDDEVAAAIDAVTAAQSRQSATVPPDAEGVEPAATGIASLAGTTAVSHGLESGSAPNASTSSAGSVAGDEQALPVVETTGQLTQEGVDSGGSGPVWAGAVAVAGTAGFDNG